MHLLRSRRALVVAGLLAAGLVSGGSAAGAAPGRGGTALEPVRTHQLTLTPPAGGGSPGRPLSSYVELGEGPDAPTEPVTLAVPELPPGWQATFDPPVLSPGAGSRMLVRIADRAQPAAHALRVTGTTAAGALVAEATYTATVYDSCDIWDNFTKDPSFEAGRTSPWRSTAGVITESPVQPASRGIFKAWLGQPDAGRVSTLSQTVWLPPTCRRYAATFDLHVDTAEPAGAPARDRLVVLANNTVLATYSNRDARAGYRTETLDLSAFADGEVRLAFLSIQGAQRRTAFVVDEVAVRMVRKPGDETPSR